VADDDARQIYALLAEDALLVQAATRAHVGMRRNRDAGGPMRLRDRAQHALHARRKSRRVRGALQDPGPNAGVVDSADDVAHEHVGHGIRAAAHRVGAAEAEVNGHIVERVDPGRDDDIGRGPLGDALDSRDEAPLTDDGEIDERAQGFGDIVGRLEDGAKGSPRMSCYCIADRLLLPGLASTLDDADDATMIRISRCNPANPSSGRTI
jgi:hypothetical protein